MNEIVKEWLKELINGAIAEAKGTIDNERIWENGYNGDDMNPHTDNIALNEEYIEVLEEIKGDYGLTEEG